MSRVRLYFKGLRNFEFPRNYDDMLSYIFVSKIKGFIKDTVDYRDFDFYTFSNFELNNVQSYDKSFISQDGIVSVVVSSVDENFLRDLVSFFVHVVLDLEGNLLSLFKFVFLDDVNRFYGECNFICISPVFLKHFSVNGDMFSYLERSLVDRFCKYNNIREIDCDYFCEIRTHGDVFQRYMDYRFEEDNFRDFYYIFDCFIVGDDELIKFAYDAGLGDNTNNGFGMLDLY